MQKRGGASLSPPPLISPLGLNLVKVGLQLRSPPVEACTALGREEGGGLILQYGTGGGATEPEEWLLRREHSAGAGATKRKEQKVPAPRSVEQHWGGGVDMHVQ